MDEPIETPPTATPPQGEAKPPPKKPTKKPPKSDPAPAPDYVLSSSPHIRKAISIRRIMGEVLLALLPATAFGLYLFGPHALWVLSLCVAGSVATEVVCQRWAGTRVTISDGSAALTGLLLGMTLPPQAPWWICLIGAVVAIGLGKHVFGGLGYNPYNPALLGRVVLLISFPAQMTAYYSPGWWGVDAVTSATPLGLLQEARIRSMGLGEATQLSMSDAFFGFMPGSIGETSTLALLAGGLFLLWRRHITWDIPVAMLGTVAAGSALFWWIDPSRYMPPQFHLMTGGLMLAAFFMATDMVTSPLTTRGKLIFGFGCGLLTVIIRLWGGYAEAVSFAILLMNSAVPIIDKYTPPRLYGTGKPPAQGPKS